MPIRRWFGKEAVAIRSATGERDPVVGMQVIAAQLLDEVAFDRPPMSPEILGSFRGVEAVRQVSMPSAARLIPQSDGFLIHVNQSHSLGKRNFSVDHEVSHILLPTLDRGYIDDFETGTFSSPREEEVLCDIGAAALLLNPRWLRPLAMDGDPTLNTLLELATLFGASLQATARQLAELSIWPCAFVFWEKDFRKEDRVSLDQILMPGLEEYGGPVAKWRVKSRYAATSFPYFIPVNKSVPATSLISCCSEAEPVTFGEEDFELGTSTGTVRVHCQNYFAPYQAAGVVRSRVISILLPAGKQSTLSQVAKAFFLESL